MSMLVMDGHRLSRPQAILDIVHDTSLRDAVERRVGCSRWHPRVHRGGEVGIGDLVAHSFAEGRESAGGAVAAEGARGGGATGGRGGAARARAPAGGASRSVGAGDVGDPGARPARCGILAKAPSVAKGIILILLQVMGGDGREAAWDQVAVGTRAAGSGGAAGVGAGTCQLGAGGAARAATADGPPSAWPRSVATREALPPTKSFAVRAHDNDVGSGSLAPPLGASSAKGACPAISY